MKRFATVFTLLLAATAANAQQAEGGFDFELMDVLQAGKMKLSIETGRLESITGGADIVLQSANQGDLQIKAGSIVFSWPEEGDQPNSITLETNVVIVHPKGNIRAAKGVWNVATGKLIFTGSPEFETPQLKHMSADSLEMNMNTGEVEILNPVATGIALGSKSGGGAGAAHGLLKEEDITGWPALLTALKAAAQADALTPGKQILNWVDPRVSSALPGIDPNQELSAVNKKMIIGELNKALRAPNLYDAKAWTGVNPGPEATALIQRGYENLSRTEIILCNRRLVEAAFPGAVAIAPPATTE